MGEIEYYLLTSVLGLILEIIMINVPGHYCHTICGIPPWIIGAYMCGTPANGSPGRKFPAMLNS